MGHSALVVECLQGKALEEPGRTWSLAPGVTVSSGEVVDADPAALAVELERRGVDWSRLWEQVGDY